MRETKPLWSSCFVEGISPKALAYTESTQTDLRLLEYELWGSIAHVLMLGKQRIIGEQHARAIVTWLTPQYQAARRGEVRLDPSLEDVHLNVETWLIAAVGLDIGGRMHTARSRNDQVVTDLRMYLRGELLTLARMSLEFADRLLARASSERQTVMLGYTHSQPAQPISYGFWLTAHASALLRDARRFLSAFEVVNVNPLGSCAISGTSFQIDRQFTTYLLAFDKPMVNALDATSTRDFVLEACSAVAISMSNLSRLAEEIVLWSTREFGVLEIDDRYATGSSIMPQKRNPVVAELARARSGTALGALAELFVVVKSVGLGYSCDLQQDKPAMWRALDANKATLEILAEQCDSMTVRRDRAESACQTSFASATELANHLVRDQGMAFRAAYQIVGRLVRALSTQNKMLSDVTSTRSILLEEGVDIREEDLAAITDPLKVVARQTSQGGTGMEPVAAAIDELRSELGRALRMVEERRELLSDRVSLSLGVATSFIEGEPIAGAYERIRSDLSDKGTEA